MHKGRMRWVAAMGMVGTVVLMGLAASSASAAPDPAPAAPAAGAATGVCAPSGASAVVGADAARVAFGVDGSGVRVGIISDSYDTGITPTAADDVASGALPGPGNPCGYETPVTVVADSAEPQSDEGRAMAQVVHGIAPGAALYFAAPTTQNDDAGIADAIDALVAQHVDVIVDDLQGDDERFFARGASGAAIAAAVEAGIAYVTAAGNYTVVGADGYPSAGHPISGWASDRYEPTPCTDDISALYPGQDVDCLDVDPGPGVDPTLRATMPPSGAMLGQLSWDEPDGAVQTHLDYVLTPPDGTHRVVSPQDAAKATIRTGLYNADAASAADLEISVVRTDPGTAGEPAVALGFEELQIAGGSELVLQDLEYFTSTASVTVGATMFGHNADPAAIRVGAVDSGTLELESYSSGGPATTAFDAAGPLPGGPATVTGPTVAGVDAIPVTFDIGSGTVFRGTSAAAPTVAAVVALAREYAPDAGVAALTSALTATARPGGYTTTLPADVDRARFVGAGLVDASALLAALEPAPPVPPTPPAPSPDAAAAASSAPAALAATGGPAPTPWAALAALLLGVGALTLRVRHSSGRHHR